MLLSPKLDDSFSSLRFEGSNRQKMLLRHTPYRPRTNAPYRSPAIGDDTVVLDSHIWKISNLHLSHLCDYEGQQEGQYPFFVRKSTHDLLLHLDTCLDEFKVKLCEDIRAENKRLDAKDTENALLSGDLLVKRRPGRELVAQTKKKTKEESGTRSILEEIDSPADFKVLSVRLPILYVDLYGNSGSGKSTIVWAYYCEYIGEKIFVTNVPGRNDLFHVVVSVGNQLRYHERMNVDALSQLLNRCHRSKIGDRPILIVFDGAYPENPINLFCEMIHNKSWFVIKCASGGPSSRFKASTSSLLIPKRFCVPGFTMDEYEQARMTIGRYMKHWRGINASLREVFHVIGGNARLFFIHYNDVSAMRDRIDDLIKGVTDKVALIEGTIGESSNQASDNIMSFFPHENGVVITLISRYAAEQLLFLTELRSISAARHIMPGNKSYLGWLHEAELYARLKLSWKKSTSFKLYDVSNSACIDVAIDGIICFDTIDQITPYAVNNDETWKVYKPGDCYHEGYDFMLVHSLGNKVRVLILQSTVSKKHSCNLNSSGQFLSKFLGENAAAVSNRIDADEDLDNATNVVQNIRTRSVVSSALKGLRNLIISRASTSLHHPAIVLSVEYVIVTTKESIISYSRPYRGSNEHKIKEHDPKFSIREKFRVYTME